MHPVVIMSYDKSPAITKAVAALEEAGMEVRVLNTATSKLTDFLGALAGADEIKNEPVIVPVTSTQNDEDSKDANADADADVSPNTADDTIEAPSDVADQPALEALVAGEKVMLELVEGTEVVLHPADITVGPKTTFKLNTAEISFWSSSMPALVENLDVSINSFSGLIKVTISDQIAVPPVLKVGKAWLKEIMA